MHPLSSSPSSRLLSLWCLGWAIPSVAVLAVFFSLFLFVLSEGQGCVWSHVVWRRNRGRVWLKSCLSSSGIMGFPLTHSYLCYERRHNSIPIINWLNAHAVNGTCQRSISCLCKLWRLLSCTFDVDENRIFKWDCRKLIKSHTHSSVSIHGTKWSISVSRLNAAVLTGLNKCL